MAQQESNPQGLGVDDTVTGFAGGTSAGATNPFNLMTDYGPAANDARNTLNASGIYLAPSCSSYYTRCYPVGYTSDLLRRNTPVMVIGRLSKACKVPILRIPCQLPERKR
jgi:hypothetical protein